MNLNMTGLGWFLKMFAFLCVDESSLGIGRVKYIHHNLCSLRVDTSILNRDAIIEPFIELRSISETFLRAGVAGFIYQISCSKPS